MLECLQCDKHKHHVWSAAESDSSPQYISYRQPSVHDRKKDMRLNKTQKVTILALVGMGLFNPFTVEVLEDWFKLVYTGLFVGCALWVMGYVLWKALKPEKTNVPVKTAKTRTQKYVV